MTDRNHLTVQFDFKLNDGSHAIATFDSLTCRIDIAGQMYPADMFLVQAVIDLVRNANRFHPAPPRLVDKTD